MACRVVIPAGMSHKVYSTKHEDPGKAERVLKFWTINGFLFITDIIESMLYQYIFKGEFIYLIYLLCKSGFFVFLFINSFHNASAFYDLVVPSALPAMQPHVESAISKASAVSDYVSHNITPGFANSLAGQMSSITIFVGSKLLSMLEFKAAATEPQRQLTHQPQANRMAMSMIAASGDGMLEIAKIDVNSTHISARKAAGASRPRPKFDLGATAI
eukprot:TRINITY_DN22907_c0_g1_i1.p1 TRINITY_DN22907_c0_g1~~TRINITY_DN22907_c0_g1_i1.p1  ORF type:complete len:216 (-),score=38.36 TRINITY_DN22907_c0_g1_i1:44-691(-)